MRRLACALVLFAGCAVTDGDHTTDATAPLVGIDGSTDHADRDCHVVLRELARLRDGGFGYQTNGGSWIWQGAIDISSAAAAEGLAPAMLYHVGADPTWHLVQATPSDGAPAGFERWAIRLDEGLPGPATPDLPGARVELVPLLALGGGGRLFDHNRNPGDFDNYALSWDRDFAIGRADAVCPAVAPVPPARLVFRGDFSEEQIGGIVPGGEVRIEYDVARLPQCRHSRNGYELWDITAHLRWEPSGALANASVRTGAATFAVPTGARRLVAWFENTSATGCQAWDSNFGANYAFDVLAPPAWLGNPMARISRDTSDPCTGGGSIDGARFDTWARQRAAITNACFQVWQPGVTDTGGDVTGAFAVTAHWRGAGTTDAYRIAPVAFDRRIGNDARFAFDLRSIDPFRAYHCPEVPVVPSADPQYVHADVELYFEVNGAELRGVAGHPFVMTFEDYAHDAFRDASCP